MKEFILLMAFLTSMVALTIDAVLPALGLMSDDLGVINRNHIQYVVSFIFVGMILGQLVYGPLSDTIGRRRALFIGIGIYLAGTMISWFAQDLTLMLAGRFLQGAGASSCRVMTMAIVRDRFEGREMARIMSLIMGCFVLIPVLAPSIGQLILYISDWRGIFAFYLIFTLIAATWAYFRLEESLPPARRKRFSARVIASGFREAAANRITLGYTLCSGLVFSMMLGYIHSAEQIFREIFGVGDMFALYFGLLASLLGVSFFINSKLVKRLGMRPITCAGLIITLVSAGLYLIVLSIWGPQFPLFLAFAALVFFALGLTFGNMSAMALEPMGHIAGMASAFLGSLSALVAVVFGAGVGQLYDGTLLPLTGGAFVMSAAALGVMIWAERGMPHAHEEQV